MLYCTNIAVVVVVFFWGVGEGGEDVYFIVGVKVQVPAGYFILKFA